MAYRKAHCPRLEVLMATHDHGEATQGCLERLSGRFPRLKILNSRKQPGQPRSEFVAMCVEPVVEPEHAYQGCTVSSWRGMGMNYQGFYPCDFGAESREPCKFHTSKAIPCGISVDHGGYTVCPNGGAYDGILDLGVRTKRLADLFDPDFAEKQTQALCSRCGVFCGIDQHKRAACQVVHGAIMSPVWRDAVQRIESLSPP